MSRRKAEEAAEAKAALEAAKKALDAASERRVQATIKAATDEARVQELTAEAMMKKAVKATVHARKATEKAESKVRSLQAQGGDALANVSEHSCVTDAVNESLTWLFAASPGTPCRFGADDRDEGSHCIEDGTSPNGWCYTASSLPWSWGPCSPTCRFAHSIHEANSGAANISASSPQVLHDALESLRQKLRALVKGLNELYDGES